MPGFEAKTKTIGGAKFTVKPLPFGKGKPGLIRLWSVIAPSIGEALSKGASVVSVFSEQSLVSVLANAISGAVYRFDEETQKWFDDAFGACSTAEIGEVKVPLTLESEEKRAMVFEQLGYSSYFEWLTFCLEVNYRKDPFEKWWAALGAAGIITRKAA